MDEILKYYSPEEGERIRKAYEIAAKVLEGKEREDHHPFIEHPLGTASIIAGTLRHSAIVAVFLHEALRFHPELADTIPEGQFTAEEWEIARSLNKIAAIKPKDTHLEAENYKRLILSYSKDPQVIIIKLADRLEVMRHAILLPKASYERKVAETILLYVPIAHQLGLYKIKSELEDIYFRCSEPEKYREITNMLRATERDRMLLTQAFIEPLSSKLEAAGITARLKSRTKTAYSIFKKMQKQNVSFRQVYDVLAIRIIIDCPPEQEKEMCWKAYSIVTEKYKPETTRLRDWITNPKPNGYESLHITVSDERGANVEIQIRTERMDAVAESGMASHWSYKGIRNEGKLTEWLTTVRKKLESGEASDYENPAGTDEVFVFTPDGELRRLPAEASILDFAFDIHTNLGLKCSGALMDGKSVSIKERLRNGSVISILTAKNQKPSPDWLNFVVTSKARNKIRQKLHEEELKKVKDGKEMLARRLKNWKMELPEEALPSLVKQFKIKSINEFFSLIADLKIDLLEIKKRLSTASESPGESVQKVTEGEKLRNDADKSVLTIDGKLGNLDYQLAKCCNPIFGDEVFGFVSIRGGIKIHRMSCPNASRMIENYPYRIQKVRWRESASSGKFQTTLRIIIDDASTYATVLSTVANFQTSLRSSSMLPRTGRNGGDFEVKLHILVSSNKELDKITSALKKTRGVASVSRIND